jgi:hypothetical protein
VGVNFEVWHFGDFYSRRATTCVPDVSGLAVCITILNVMMNSSASREFMAAMSPRLYASFHWASSTSTLDVASDFCWATENNVVKDARDTAAAKHSRSLIILRILTYFLARSRTTQETLLTCISNVALPPGQRCSWKVSRLKSFAFAGADAATPQ